MLVLTPRFPYPVVGGDRLRIYQICKALSQHFSITLLSFCESKEELRYTPDDGLFAEVHRIYLPKWQSYLNTLRALPSKRPLQLGYYQSSRFARKVRDLLSTHDIALAHLIRTGQYLEGHSKLPCILEMTDAISLNYERMRGDNIAFSIKKLIYKIEYSRLSTYERQVVCKFRSTWLVSETDRLALDPDKLSPIEVIPNGTDAQRFPFFAGGRGGDTIAFIGNMMSVQNQDACLYFIKSIFPLIQRHKHLKFRIIGNMPSAVQRKFHSYSDIEITGRLANIADGIDDTVFCAVCTVQAGAGIQNKVLEYFALGLPCVVSPVGAEGIDAQPGKDFLLYKDAEDAAQKILSLHANIDLRMSLATSARRLVETTLNWEFIASHMTRSAKELL